MNVVIHTGNHQLQIPDIWHIKISLIFIPARVEMIPHGTFLGQVFTICRKNFKWYAFLYVFLCGNFGHKKVRGKNYLLLFANSAALAGLVHASAVCGIMTTSFLISFSFFFFAQVLLYFLYISIRSFHPSCQSHYTYHRHRLHHHQELAYNYFPKLFPVR